MYGHQTRLSWPETRVKIYFWGEIMACHTLQTKQNKHFFVVHFIYKYNPDPTKSQQNRKLKGFELVIDKFHFPQKHLDYKLIFHPS